MNEAKGLSRVRSSEKPVGKTVRVPREDPPRVDGAAAPPTVARPAGPRGSGKTRAPFLTLCQEITEPLRRGRGIRVLFLGKTGSGKSTAARALIDYIVDEQLVELVFIHDIKEPEPQYEGQVIAESSDVVGQGATVAPADGKTPAVFVLRRSSREHKPSTETAARDVLDSGYAKISALLLVDEGKRILSPERRVFLSTAIAELYSEGRALHASLIVCDTQPEMPKEGFDQSRIVLCHLGRKSTGYLVDRRVIDEPTAAIVNNLHMAEDPRGPGLAECILVDTEDDFDGRIFVIPKP